MSANARSAAAHAQRPQAAQIAARLGYAVNGLLNATIGALALGIVGVASGGEADPNGALTSLARGPGGLVLIWIIVVGMLALGLWYLASAIRENGTNPRRRRLARASLIAKGVAYLVIAALACGVAIGGGGGGESEEDFTAGALGTPGGVVLVVVVGLAALAVGGYLIAKGLRRTFLDDLNLPAGAVETATTLLGVVGYVARGIAIGVVGILFIAAAVTADASHAGGLDKALARLAALPYGQVALVAIGVGFIAYGVYGVARARFARL